MYPGRLVYVRPKFMCVAQSNAGDIVMNTFQSDPLPLKKYEKERDSNVSLRPTPKEPPRAGNGTLGQTNWLRRMVEIRK